MKQRLDFSQTLRNITELKKYEERAQAMKSLAQRKRIEIGAYRGRKVKLNLCKKITAKFRLVTNVGEYVTGYVTDVSDNFCKLDSPQPSHLRFVDTIRILSLELL